MTTTVHTPVLLQEAISSLNLKEGKIFLDGTYGGGGHSREALRLFPGIRHIALDRDPNVPGVIHESFRNLDKVLKDLKIEQVDAILLDLGISSDQLESHGLPAGRQGRGFSFLKDEPLDMRMGTEGPTAADILNTWEEETLELIIRGFGEERYSRKIAKEIVKRRAMTPFLTTLDLLEAVRAATPAAYHRGRIHPATRTFQALRIAVNDELPTLEAGLKAGWEALAPKGRLAVISFHSLEDRIVKNMFKEFAKAGGVILTKKPIVAGAEEVAQNPRSRSAKLRVIEKQ